MEFLDTQFLRKKREYHCVPHSNNSSEETDYDNKKLQGNIQPSTNSNTINKSLSNSTPSHIKDPLQKNNKSSCPISIPIEPKQNPQIKIKSLEKDTSNISKVKNKSCNQVIQSNTAEKEKIIIESNQINQRNQFNQNDQPNQIYIKIDQGKQGSKEILKEIKQDKKIEHNENEPSLLQSSSSVALTEAEIVKKFTNELNSLTFDDSNDYNLFNHSYVIITKFINVLKCDNAISTKEKLLTELLRCVNDILNSNKKYYQKIKYGMDNLYSRTLFYNFLHYFAECLKEILESTESTFEQRLKDYDLFVKFFNEKTNHYFKFMTNYNNHIVDLLKKELFIYIFLYKKMLVNPNIYECFNINPYSRKFYSNNLIPIMRLKGHVKSKLFTETLWYLLGIQDISIGIDDIRDMVENELNNTRVFYVPLPNDMLSFSLVNGSILINERFSFKTFQEKKEIQAKAIILVLFLSEFANIITRKSFKEFDDKNYFEKNYFFDYKFEKNISCFYWMYHNLFGGITDFYYCNSKFIIDIENYKGYYKNFNEFREKLNNITKAPDTHFHCKNVEIFDPAIATEAYYK